MGCLLVNYRQAEHNRPSLGVSKMLQRGLVRSIGADAGTHFRIGRSCAECSTFLGESEHLRCRRWLNCPMQARVPNRLAKGEEDWRSSRFGFGKGAERLAGCGSTRRSRSSMQVVEEKSEVRRIEKRSVQCRSDRRTDTGTCLCMSQVLRNKAISLDGP